MSNHLAKERRKQKLAVFLMGVCGGMYKRKEKKKNTNFLDCSGDNFKRDSHILLDITSH